MAVICHVVPVKADAEEHDSSSRAVSPSKKVVPENTWRRASGNPIGSSYSDPPCFRYGPQGKPLDQHHRLRVRCRENRSPRYHSWILRGAKTSSPCRSSQISLEQKSGSDYRDWRRLSISSISSSRCKLLFPLLAVVVVLKSAATATAVVSANWPASYAETNPGGLKQRMKPPSLMSFTREQTDHQILYHKLFSDHQHLKYLFASYLMSFFFVQLTSWGIL